MISRTSGTIVDIHNRRVFQGHVEVREGVVVSVVEDPDAVGPVIMPGFVDAHIHIESSMVMPSEFARVAVLHGTVGTVSDPHEIANVLGIEGVRAMIENGEEVPFSFAFGAPSCVPATSFESAGAELGPAEVEELLRDERVLYLSEMMNYPGVIFGDPEVAEKIAIAKRLDLPVDGHAPGVRGEELRKYVAAGISTDHESFSYDEGREKLELGMKLLIREGSAARNFDALIPLLSEYPDQCMFCSDDRHPDDLIEGHINLLVKRAVANGVDLMTALRTASLHPVEHYGLSVGLLREGDRADFIEVDNLEDLNVLRTVIGGRVVAEKGESRIASVPLTRLNNFTPQEITSDDLRLMMPEDRASSESVKVNVIEALDGEIVTGRVVKELPVVDREIVVDPEQDVLKIVVANRYTKALPAVALITGFRLGGGALASSVAHDSHNVVAVGRSDREIARAINLVMEQGGGLSAVGQQSDGAESELLLPLPIAGLMSDQDPWSVAKSYATLDNFVRTTLGSTLGAPYMTLSFMALLVIPSLKLSDKGLFDGEGFRFEELVV